MPAMTPMKCFLIKDDAIYTMDTANHRQLVCVAANEDARDFLLHSLTNFHTSTPTLTWDKTRAITPFTEKQIAELEKYQRSAMHPYTCEKGHGFLVATKDGFRCPWTDCEYVQTWAHAEHTGVK